MGETIRTLPVSCNLDCGGGCPLLATVEGGRVTSIIDNPAGGPYLSGCIRGYNAHRVLYAPDRLRHPLLRVGPRGSGQFREIPWDEALDRVAEGLSGIKCSIRQRGDHRLGRVRLLSRGAAQHQQAAPSLSQPVRRLHQPLWQLQLRRGQLHHPLRPGRWATGDRSGHAATCAPDCPVGSQCRGLSLWL